MAPDTPLDAHPDDELLAALAMDDLDDVPAQARAHVAGCPHCSRAVDELRRTAMLVRASASLQPGPAPHVWEGVLREVREPSDAVAAEPAAPAVPRPRGRRSWSVPAVAAAVVVALALGAGVGVLWGRRTDDVPPPEANDTFLARAELSTVDGVAARGQAAVVRRHGKVELRVWGDDLGDDAGVHEVWLLNEDGKRMVALGLLGEGDAGTFAMPARLLDQGYVVVDVSLEPDDGDPTHSGDSLARGELRGG